jgi:hypothetical protein
MNSVEEAGERPRTETRAVFLKWEKLRLPYNIVLAVVLVGSYLAYFGTRVPPVPLLWAWLVGAILANICFLVAPAVESYAAWLGFRSRILTWILFVGGIVVSIPCVIGFLPVPWGAVPVPWTVM